MYREKQTIGGSGEPKNLAARFKKLNISPENIEFADVDVKVPANVDVKVPPMSPVRRKVSREFVTYLKSIDEKQNTDEKLQSSQGQQGSKSRVVVKRRRPSQLVQPTSSDHLQIKIVEAKQYNTT